jgi:uncharacterized protein YjbI with pentapeptide repeats
MAKLKTLYKWVLGITKDYWLIAIFILGLVALFFLVGYWLFGNWNWTGLIYYETATVTTEIIGSNPPASITTELHPGKTLWDILELAIIPLAIAVGVWWLNRQEREAERQLAKRRAQTDLEIALDRTRETTLQSFLDRMAELMLKEGLRVSKPNDEVRSIARALTLTTLLQLNRERKAILLQFLYEAELINKDKRIIDLRGADFKGGIDLYRAKLNRVDLSETNLSKASFFGADLSEANLYETDLCDAELIMADLRGANLNGADLRGASLMGAKINETTQIDDKWHLVWEILNRNVEGRNLSKMDLSEANLVGANLRKADLRRADLRGTALREADLCGADLRQAHLAPEFDEDGDLLIEGVNLTGAKYNNTTLWPANFNPARLGAVCED